VVVVVVVVVFVGVVEVGFARGGEVGGRGDRAELEAEAECERGRKRGGGLEGDVR
jgi:hypothetical protein